VKVEGEGRDERGSGMDGRGGVKEEGRRERKGEWPLGERG